MLVAPNRSINTCEQSLATTNENCVAQFSSPTSNTPRKPARDTGCAARAPDTMQTSRNDGSPDPKALLTSMEHYAVGLAVVHFAPVRTVAHHQRNVTCAECCVTDGVATYHRGASSTGSSRLNSASKGMTSC